MFSFITYIISMICCLFLIFCMAQAYLWLKLIQGSRFALFIPKGKLKFMIDSESQFMLSSMQVYGFLWVMELHLMVEIESHILQTTLSTVP